MTRCPSCQGTVAPGAAYCGACGTPLDARTGPSTQPLSPGTPPPDPGQRGAHPPVAYAPVPYPGAPWATAARPTGRSRTGLLLAALAGLLLLGGAIGWFVVGDRLTTTQAQPAQRTSTVFVDPPAATPAQAADQQTVQAPAPAPAVQAPAPAYPVVQSRGGRECQRQGEGPYAAVGTDNTTTSCPFAINVRQAYLGSGIDGGTGAVVAHSPTTGKTYTLTCSGSQPVLCTGGVAGRVLIYGGPLQ